MCLFTLLLYDLEVKLNIKKFTILLAFVFLTAFLLRTLIINWTLQYGNNVDFVSYEDWARTAHVQNFAATYTTPTRHSADFTTLPNNQPPGSLYILTGSYELWISAGKLISRLTNTVPGSITAVNTILQHTIMKIPSLITDLGMGLIAYLLVAKQVGRKKGLLATSLILFNPVIFYNSAIWGQMDSINNFFFLLSLFLAFRKNIILSILAFAASLFVKLSLLPLLPLYLLFLFFMANKNIKRILLGIALSAATIALAVLPISTDLNVWLSEILPAITRGVLQSITSAAFNFWWMIFCFPTVGHVNIPQISQLFLSIPLSLWAYGLFGILALPFLYFQIKKSETLISKHYAFLAFSMIALLAFLFLPGMHDRYMYPVFPLLAIAIGLSKRIKAYLPIFALLSFFNLSNVVYSWFPIVFDSTTTFYHVFYGDYFGWIISALTVLTSTLFYLKTINHLKKSDLNKD